MLIKLLFEEDVPDDVERPARNAERDFEWEEGMEDTIVVVNPNNPVDTLRLMIYNNELDEGGVPMCSVIDRKGRPASFDEILKYGFVEIAPS